jgi:hypothetical protein
MPALKRKNPAAGKQQAGLSKWLKAENLNYLLLATYLKQKQKSVSKDVGPFGISAQTLAAFPE